MKTRLESIDEVQFADWIFISQTVSFSQQFAACRQFYLFKRKFKRKLQEMYFQLLSKLLLQQQISFAIRLSNIGLGISILVFERILTSNFNIKLTY